MEESQIFPRLRDLYTRCVNKNIVTNTAFLTPREQAEALEAARRHWGCTPYFFGGWPDAERRMAFFLPDYLDAGSFDPSPYLRAIRAQTPFAAPTHRDYLGALMNLGIERECIGDILLRDGAGYFFLTPAITPHVLDSLVRVGRGGVSLSEVALDSLPAFAADLREITFTVQSMRADAVVSGIFRISRSACQPLFQQGEVTLNYFPCLDKDAPVCEGDILSLRHHGKARILSSDGRSKKGRIFVTAGIYQ